MHLCYQVFLENSIVLYMKKKLNSFHRIEIGAIILEKEDFLIVWGFSSHSRIFHSFLDVTNTGRPMIGLMTV